jgi:hypothetical protein
MKRPVRVFLLSPANCSGLRAQMLLRPEADFELARRLRNGGASLGEVFSFLSGLYFRGKMAYARRFVQGPKSAPGVLVISAGRGLLEADTRVGPSDLREFAEVPIDAAEPRYRGPLAEAARALAAQLPASAQAVLLGSVATDKYVSILAAALGPRLVFPQDFVGRGDMSRGGLMLRCVREDRELDYVPVQDAIRRGRRPPKLPRLP